MRHELPPQPIKLPEISIDKVVVNASLASQSTVSMKNFSVRLPEDLKSNAQTILAAHATDLGTFLRECTRALVESYQLDSEANQPVQEHCDMLTPPAEE